MTDVVVLEQHTISAGTTWHGGRSGPVPAQRQPHVAREVLGRPLSTARAGDRPLDRPADHGRHAGHDEPGAPPRVRALDHDGAVVRPRHAPHLSRRGEGALPDHGGRRPGLRRVRPERRRRRARRPEPGARPRQPHGRCPDRGARRRDRLRGRGRRRRRGGHVAGTHPDRAAGHLRGHLVQAPGEGDRRHRSDLALAALLLHHGGVRGARSRLAHEPGPDMWHYLCPRERG